MEYITLKNTELNVSRVCMGGCPMGGYGWGKVSEEELLKAIKWHPSTSSANLAKAGHSDNK